MQKTNRNLSIGNLILLAWSVLCISVFIYFPGRVSFIQWANLAEWQFFPAKLGRIDLLKYSTNLLGSFVGVVVFSCACFSIGMFIGKKFKINTKFEDVSDSQTTLSKLAWLSTDFLLGHTILSIVFLALSSIYKLIPLYVAIILIVGVLSGVSHIKLAVPNFFVKLQMEDKESKLIFWLSAIILLLVILQSSARISYDSSAIYFSDAKLTALSNNVRYFTDDTFVASVFHSTIQYTALIQLFGDQAARMFSWVCGMVIVIFGLALGERVGLSKQAMVILLALLSTSTALIDLMGDGKVDLITSAPAVATIYWMVVQTQTKQPGKSVFVLIGLLMGLAIIGRPFNAFLLGIFSILFYFQGSFLSSGFKTKSITAFFFPLFWIGIGAIGLGILHLLANWIILGSPFAFISSITQIDSATGPWDANPNQILALRLLYPLVASFRNNPQSLGNVSPLAIAFLPAILIYDIRRKIKLSKDLLVITIISGITIILWIFTFFTVVELRYVLFLWIILFMPVAEIIASALRAGDRLFRNMIEVPIIALLVFIIFRTIFISLDSYSPLDQQGNPHCYDYVFCEYLKPINQTASPGDRVLTLSAYRYYLRTDLFACSPTHEEYKILHDLSYQDTEAFWQEVYQRGYKYISYENDYTVRHLGFGIIPAPENVPDWLELEPIFGNPQDLVVAYRIHATAPPVDVKYSCIKNADDKWEVVKIK
jgi:hypothetical protein